jgi:hypothetical protein
MSVPEDEEDGVPEGTVGGTASRDLVIVTDGACATGCSDPSSAPLVPRVAAAV